MPVHHKDNTVLERDTEKLKELNCEIFDMLKTPSFHCVCFGRVGDKKAVAKFIRFDQYFDLTFRMDRLPQKLVTLKKLNHDNIINIYEVLHFEYATIIFSEYCGDGTDLQQLVYLHRGLGEESSKFYYRQIGSALAYLHSNKSAHYDVRCDNVLLDHEGLKAKLTIIGIQMWKHPPKIRPYYSLIGTFHGSGPYLAPEMLYGRPTDPFSCDVWAMGVLLYYMITHEFPFTASNIQDMVDVQAKGVFNIDPKWSSELKYLLKTHFSRAPLMRRSMVRLMNHAWLTADTDLTSS